MSKTWKSKKQEVDEEEERIPKLTGKKNRMAVRQSLRDIMRNRDKIDVEEYEDYGA